MKTSQKIIFHNNAVYIPIKIKTSNGNPSKNFYEDFYKTIVLKIKGK